MDTKAYHHGNLKQELIERGLEYIARNGVENLSMRKLSALCGVSSAAPYAHFGNKEVFLSEVQSYITKRFAETLRNTVESCKTQNEVLVGLGVSYVMFFHANPTYFSFIFTHGNIDIEKYPPFTIFRKTASDILHGLYGSDTDEELIRHKITAMWAMVHGLAQLYTYPAFLSNEEISKDGLEKEISAVLLAVRI